MANIRQGFERECLLGFYWEHNSKNRKGSCSNVTSDSWLKLSNNFRSIQGAHRDQHAPCVHDVYFHLWITRQTWKEHRILSLLRTRADTHELPSEVILIHCPTHPTVLINQRKTDQHCNTNLKIWNFTGTKIESWLLLYIGIFAYFGVWVHMGLAPHRSRWMAADYRCRAGISCLVDVATS